uniref:Uncharacterized protein n=1 Tax=Arundo donax TaxID=35708 RepID=A0A0A8YXN7_ARUDO
MQHLPALSGAGSVHPTLALWLY